jgi:transcription-repair coupling factor (superfamily II helicase)
VDVLTLTATPIPRTLHMALTGVRDISIIDTAPAERLPVETWVGEADDSRIRTAILRELDRGGQVFFVHNRVQSINIVRKRLEKLVPEARVVVAHGQMSERQLEKIMVEFAEANVDILLSTTIIESGSGLPQRQHAHRRPGGAVRSVAALPVARAGRPQPRAAPMPTSSTPRGAA